MGSFLDLFLDLREGHSGGIRAASKRVTFQSVLDHVGPPKGPCWQPPGQSASNDVVSEVALRLPEVACAAVSARCVPFPAERAQRAKRAERPRHSEDRTGGANAVNTGLATAVPRIYVIEALGLGTSLLLSVRVSLSPFAAASTLAKVRRSHAHALGRSHKLKRASRSLSNAGFEKRLLSRTRV